jgi:hypothetical protein
LDKNRRRTLTPVVGQLLNLPPYLRSRAGALFLHAILPEGAKDPEPYLDPLFEELVALQEGIPMFDAIVNDWVTVTCTVLYDNNDIIGAFRVSGRRGANTIIEPCHVCDLKGRHVPELRARVYVGAHRSLTPLHPLRYIDIFFSSFFRKCSYRCVDV